MRAIPVKYVDKYYNAIDDEIRSLTRRGKWQVVPGKSFEYQNIIPRTWSIKWKSKTDWNIRKFKVRNYVKRGDTQKIPHYKTLNMHSTVVYGVTVGFIFIFQSIIGLRFLKLHKLIYQAVFQEEKQYSFKNYQGSKSDG